MRFGPRLARGLSIVLGLGLLVTALLHGSGLTQVRAAVANTSADLEALFPALWLAFAVHYLVLGALVLVATGPANGLSWRLLGIAAAAPLTDALLQVIYFGFIPPTAILLVVAALGLAAAAVSRESARPAA
jgi:hypothetical protein